MEGSDESTGESCVTGTTVQSPPSTLRVAHIRCARAALMLSNLRALSEGTVRDKGNIKEMMLRANRLLENSTEERRKELEGLKHLDDLFMVILTLLIVVAILCVFVLGVRRWF